MVNLCLDVEHRVKRQIYSKSLAQQNVTSSSLKVDYLLFRNTSDVVQVMITKKKSDAKSALKFCLYCKTTELIQSKTCRGKQCGVSYPYRPVSVCTSIKASHYSASAYPSRSQRLGDSITCDQRQEVSNEDGRLTGQKRFPPLVNLFFQRAKRPAWVTSFIYIRHAATKNGGKDFIFRFQEM